MLSVENSLFAPSVETLPKIESISDQDQKISKVAKEVLSMNPADILLNLCAKSQRELEDDVQKLIASAKKDQQEMRRLIDLNGQLFASKDKQPITAEMRTQMSELGIQLPHAGDTLNSQEIAEIKTSIQLKIDHHKMQIQSTTTEMSMRINEVNSLMSTAQIIYKTNEREMNTILANMKI